MEIIQKIHRITDLPELSNVAKSKLIVAYNRKNYVIDGDIIAGKKIVSINERKSEEDGGRNMITIKFSDGTSKQLYTYNGSKGDTGGEGLEGPKGKTGIAASTDLNRVTDATDLMKIVNDYATAKDDIAHDNTCKQAWSAFRGKYMNDKINSMAETFISDEEYEILWNEDIINYMYAEFTTTEDNHETVIFANDTNSHKVFKKFWTYEEGDVATYYVAIYGVLTYVDEDGVEHEQLDEDGNPKIGIVRYDPIVANIWDDIYLGETEGYFPATTNQLNDLSVLYIWNPKTEKYEEITIDRDEKIGDDPETATPNPNYKNKDIDFYSEGMKENLHAHYENQTNMWSYSFDEAKPFKKPLYKEDTSPEHTHEVLDEVTGEVIGINYDILPVAEDEEIIQGTQYYFSKDKSSAIDDVENYLNFSQERLYLKVWNEEKTAYQWEEQEYITKYLTQEDKDAYINSLKSKEEEIILLSIDQVEQSYTFERIYPTTVKKETVYESVSEVYCKGNQPILYAKFDKREYYTGEIRTVVDEETNTTSFVTDYTKIPIPSWIIAEFTTTYEDEVATVLNSVTELGREDNTIIDITAEDYEDVEDIEVIPVKFVAWSGMEKIYNKNDDGTFTEVSLENINLTRVDPYYTLKGEWIELTSSQAMAEPSSTKLYYKDQYGEMRENNSAIEVDKTYWKWESVSTPIEDESHMSTIGEFIKYAGVIPQPNKDNSNITIFTGIPKQLPIVFVPGNSTYKFAKIEYDSDIVTLFEDGRICAIGEQLDENNETHTTLTITPINPETNEKTGNELVLNIKVLTPMTSVIVEKDGEKVETKETQPIYINRQVVKETTTDTSEDEVEEPLDETIKLDYIVSPLTTSNKKLAFTISDETVLSIPKVDEKFNENKTIATLNGLKKGKVLVTAEAVDTFGANAKCWVEVVEPVTDVEWKLENEAGKPKVEKKDDEYIITLLKDVEYEYLPDITPLDASYPELVWSSSNSTIVEVKPKIKTIVDEPEVLATEEDVDDGTAKEVGEVIKEAVTHQELTYSIIGKKITSKDGYELDRDGNETDIRVSISGELENVYGKLAEDDENLHEIVAYVIVNQSVEEVTVTPKAFAFNIGTSKKLNAKLVPETAVQEFHWESSDSSIVSVADDGTITAIKPGIAKVFAKADDGSSQFGTCDITVTVPATNIDLSSNEPTAINGIVYVGRGKNAKINAEIIYDNNPNATDETRFGVNWSSSDTSVATVSGNNDTNECTVSGVALGSSTIIATAKDKSGTLGAIQVVVIELVESIEFETSEYTLDVNDSLSLMPKFSPVASTNQVLAWTSSDESKAIVNNSGIVTALDSTGDDTVTITATTTDGSDKTATCTIKIN